ncbi:hypothetical protein MTO96_031482 [Rhipicephalus appendiculatus]
MPPKKALNDVSRSGTPSPARAVTPVDTDAAGFSPEGDDILGRLQALTEAAAPSVFAGPVQASDEDDDDVGTSVSGTTAVASGLPADVGGRVQRRVREIEDEVSRFLTDSTNKVPVPARNFIMSRLFELVACCGDLRVEAASEKGAAMALQGQLVETRREMAAQQMKSLDVIPGLPAVPGWPGLADADLAGCPGAPGAPPAAPPAAPGGPRSYAAALAGAGASLAPSAFGLDAGDLSAQVCPRYETETFILPAGSRNVYTSRERPSARCTAPPKSCVRPRSAAARVVSSDDAERSGAQDGVEAKFLPRGEQSVPKRPCERAARKAGWRMKNFSASKAPLGRYRTSACAVVNVATHKKNWVYVHGDPRAAVFLALKRFDRRDGAQPVFIPERARGVAR